MKDFAALYASLDETTKTTVKVEAMVEYFRRVGPEDAAWAVYFLIGRKPRQVIPSAKLRAWAAEQAGVSEWLFEESYHAVGDLAETVALLLPEPSTSSDLPLQVWVEERLLPLRGSDEEVQHRAMTTAWAEMSNGQRFVWNKLITGAFRVGVSQQLVTRALAKVAGLDAPTVAHRLMGEWEPTPLFFERLTSIESHDAAASRPYPFFLAHPIEADPSTLGARSGWQAEWKWDGIRAQLMRRQGQTFLWSRGEELVTERYPELAAVAPYLPDGTVIDGELLPWQGGRVMPFAQLQRRIGRKTVGKAILAEVPVVLMAYDLLEHEGKEFREMPLEVRRERLEAIIRGAGWDGRIMASPILSEPTWEALAESPRGEPRAGRRRDDAQAAWLDLPGRTGPGRLVEVEDHPAVDRRRADRRPARERQAGQPLHRLHLRRLVGRQACHHRQGVFWTDRRGDRQGRSLHPCEYRRQVRPGPHRQAAARVRDRIRRHPALGPPQVGDRSALPPDRAATSRQDRERGRLARIAPRLVTRRSRGGPVGRLGPISTKTPRSIRAMPTDIR